MKSLHSSKNVFKKPQNRSKCLTLLEKASHHFKETSITFKKYLKVSLQKASSSSKKPHFIRKASISLKMPSKRIEIFTKASVSLKIFEKCQAFLQSKKPHILKTKCLTTIAALPQWPVRPCYYTT
jgi:hypothetical protein